MDKDFRELLSVLNAHSVRYLVIGGYAISFHSEPRATKDLDIFIESTPQNATAVYQALCEFGAPVAEIPKEVFEDGTTTFQIGVAPYRVDIIQQIDGVAFQDAWESRILGQTDPDDPMTVNYMSIDDLIRNKTASGRLRDLADVEDLQAAKQAQKKD
ncbi:DUF6036 family nucleotidyltransferase [Terriglobus sp. 2YAB30_2]|uniref:DUF6036 family nucleotidyltransferase n=1 Tax=Terriglobus sp. 2YAB30_2 TaxID=3233023 RepID=UPI003F9C5E13